MKPPESFRNLALALPDSLSLLSLSILVKSTYVVGEIGDNGELVDERELGDGCPKLGTNSRITDLSGFKFVSVICPFPVVWDHDCDLEWEPL